MRQRFYVVRNEISAGSDKRQRISPLTPIIKIANFGNVISLDKVSDFNNGRLF